jgi:hypothetical protein
LAAAILVGVVPWAVLAADLPAALAPKAAVAKAKVKGYAVEPVREKLDRGLVAVRAGEGKVHVGWRLLESDPAGVAFDLFRQQRDQPAVKLNPEPIRKTTDFLDAAAPAGSAVRYFVRPVVGGRQGEPSPAASLGSNDPDRPYLTIKLQGDHTFQKVGIADLDGDGRLDFVIKQPNENIDPYENYWTPSPDTYKLEAYRHDGRFLWRYDLGWAIERGIWYSPYVVYDLDGDGKAEVAVKTGEGDPRGPDGRVQTGPEYLAILDGQTGKPLCRVDWPSRAPFGPKGYNYASRNQLAVAYLDGKTPCLLVERGTYTYMTLVAYEFHAKRLRELWRWDNEKLGRAYRGQGAHWMHAADVDGDGRDEALLGSCVIDDDGSPLWTTGLGHPDHFYVGDIDPSHPGLEIYYGIEPGGPRNTMCLVDARTGQFLWGHEGRTQHIHHSGMCSDIDPAHPGAECYSGERDFPDKRWLRDCKGNVLSTEDLGGLGPRPVYWDADPQRELILGRRIAKYRGPTLLPRVEGEVIAVVDLVGDWREEIITSLPGELRIYTTPIPATDRRVCLLQDRLYRMDVVCAAMGYYQVPMLSYDMASQKR